MNKPWWRRRRTAPARPELIDRKHQIAGEITMLSAEVKRRRASGRPIGDAEQRLERLRHEHHQTRLAIDRAEHG